MLIRSPGIFLCVLIFFFFFFGGKLSSEMKDCKQSFSEERLMYTRKKKSPPGGFSTAEDNMGLRSQLCLAPSAPNHSYCLNCNSHFGSVLEQLTHSWGKETEALEGEYGKDWLRLREGTDPASPAKCCTDLKSLGMINKKWIRHNSRDLFLCFSSVNTQKGNSLHWSSSHLHLLILHIFLFIYVTRSLNINLPDKICHPLS